MSLAARLRGRTHAAYIAFLIHRLSGIGLAVFLPLHFLALGQAIQGPQALDGFLDWSRQPLVKAAEAGLVLLLAAHLTGGLRVLAIEAGSTRAMTRAVISLGLAASLAIALMFLLGVWS
ncbi:MAG: succinate dehydrogenase [Alphaproteobacteria bacterium]|nr:succinate dehydrogenase [Alphaproteobacteria bacterium]